MNRLFIIVLVLLVLAGPMLGKASADWGWLDGGNYNYDWTPHYYGW